MQKKYGVIDIGSNTIRFAIYEHDKAGRFREVDNIKTVARLRNYLDEEENLSEQGIQILLETLKSYQDIADYHNITHVKGAATATIRRSANQAKIMKRISKVTSFDIRVFSEYEEAYYGYLAVVNSMDIEDGITIDIGGGSTEVTLFKNRRLIHDHSFPFGALSLKRRFVSGDVPTKQECAEIRAFLKEQFQSLSWLKGKALPVVGIGGSARNMAQIHEAMTQYPLGGLHQYEMKRENIEEVLEELKGLDLERLKKVDGLSEDRADIIIPALEVFKQFCAITDAPTFTLSRRGLRDGIFYEELLNGHDLTAFPNVLEESLFELTFEYDMNVAHSLQTYRLAQQLFHEFDKLGVCDLSKKDLKLLKRASQVFYLGDYIDSEAGSQHTFYVLANRTIDGLNHCNRLKLALVASFKSKSVFKQYIQPYETFISKEEQRTLRLLGSVLKVASALNATKRDIVQSLRVEEKDDTLHVYVSHTGQIAAESYEANKQKKHLEKSVKQAIQFHFSS